MLSLRQGVVYVVRASLDAAWPLARPEQSLLTEPELHGVGRLRFPAHRRHAARSRAYLRSLLGEIRREDPQKVPIATGPTGKPYCRDGPAFNVSHSGGHLLIALSRTGRLGVDIEIMNELPEMDGVMASHFSSGERSRILQHTPGQRLKAFYRCWTRKEALVKALGGGLTLPLHQFSVDVDARKGNVLLAMDLPGTTLQAWRILPLEAPDGLAAALAHDTPETAVVELDWQPFGSPGRNRQAPV